MTERHAVQRVLGRPARQDGSDGALHGSSVAVAPSAADVLV